MLLLHMMLWWMLIMFMWMEMMERISPYTSLRCRRGTVIPKEWCFEETRKSRMSLYLLRLLVSETIWMSWQAQPKPVPGPPPGGPPAGRKQEAVVQYSIWPVTKVEVQWCHKLQVRRLKHNLSMSGLYLLSHVPWFLARRKEGATAEGSSLAANR